VHDFLSPHVQPTTNYCTKVRSTKLCVVHLRRTRNTIRILVIGSQFAAATDKLPGSLLIFFRCVIAAEHIKLRELCRLLLLRNHIIFSFTNSPNTIQQNRYTMMQSSIGEIAQPPASITAGAIEEDDSSLPEAPEAEVVDENNEDVVEENNEDHDVAAPLNGHEESVDLGQLDVLLGRGKIIDMSESSTSFYFYLVLLLSAH
jgi:hypothetical protein